MKKYESPTIDGKETTGHRGILKRQSLPDSNVPEHGVLKNATDNENQDLIDIKGPERGVLKHTHGSDAETIEVIDTKTPERGVLKHKFGSLEKVDTSESKLPNHGILKHTITNESRLTTDTDKKYLKRFSFPNDTFSSLSSLKYEKDCPSDVYTRRSSLTAEASPYREGSPEKSALKKTIDQNTSDVAANHRISLSPEKSSLKKSLNDPSLDNSSVSKKPEGILKKCEIADKHTRPSKSILKKDSVDRKYEDDFSKATDPETSADFAECRKHAPTEMLYVNVDEMTVNIDETVQKDNSDESDDVISKNDGTSIITNVQNIDRPHLRQRSKNDAVTRRRAAKEMRKSQNERYMTQPADITPDTVDNKKQPYASIRHLTQPVTPEEKEEAQLKFSSGSILERVNSLKKRGKEEWRKRLDKNLEEEFANIKNSGQQGDRCSIADRVSKLGHAQQNWQARISQNDAKVFTVEEKLKQSKSGSTPPLSPMLKTRREKVPVPKKLISSEPSSLVSSPTSPDKMSFETSSSTSPEKIPDETDPSPMSSPDKDEIVVPKIDEAISDSFFPSSSKIGDVESISVSYDDFDELFIKSQDMLAPTVKIRPKRHNASVKRNPLKTQSVQILDTYTETPSGVAANESCRKKLNMVIQNSSPAQRLLAEAAVKGLKSLEDYNVKLRKVSRDSGIPGSQPHHEPYKDLMLLQVKGRRHVQTRLVEPCAKSINSGDCFVLVTVDKIYNWIGDYSNVIEKSKSAELASFIQQKKDLGFKGSVGVITLDEHNTRSKLAHEFWKLLGGLAKYQEAGPVDEDIAFETHLTDTNMFYQFKNNTLTPYEKYWGSTPQYEMLDHSEIIVFDFGSELYVWFGQRAQMEQRKEAMKLAKRLWEQGYDYSMCSINPVYPLRDESSDSQALRHSASRPSWALFGKVNQNMETILFREKFIDWPDSSHLIGVRRQISCDADLSDVKAYDVRLMLPMNTSPVTFMLEGSNVARGDNWIEDHDGIVRVHNIITLEVQVWHIVDFEKHELPVESYGQFHDQDTYVVRWRYKISIGGKTSRRSLSTGSEQVGRERCAFFYWQGKGSSSSEKGTSALMTVELDEDRCPQVRIEEGNEPACFLNLFKGSAVIHRGKRGDCSRGRTSDVRMYFVRGEFVNEICLMEIETSAVNLRSRHSYIILNVSTGTLWVWHGCKSSPTSRSLACAIAAKLKSRCPIEYQLRCTAIKSVNECVEGSEDRSFWKDLGGGNQEKHLSLLKDDRVFNQSTRLFHFAAPSGEFVASEIIYLLRTNEHVSPMPFFQSQIYSVSQPALFMVDDGHDVYMWQGCWPHHENESENIRTGSAIARFCALRRCALETSLNYCKEKYQKSNNCWIVYAGLEPKVFINLFPFWSVNDSLRGGSLKDGHIDGEMVSGEQVLKQITDSKYSFAQISGRQIPDVLDPLHLESYLDDEEFERVLHMTRDQFLSLPNWKQINLKRNLGLY